MRKILWAILGSSVGISSAVEYNTAVQNVVNQGGDPNDPVQLIQNAPGGAASRVGGFTGVVNTFPQTDASYAAGDVIVAPDQVQGAFRPGINTGMLQSISVFDSRGVAAPLVFVFWRRFPEGHAARNAAFGISSTLAPRYIGHVSFSADDYTAAGTGTIAIRTSLALPLSSIGSDADLWYSAYSVDAVNYGTEGQLRLVFGILRD
jgi:hypothetical protein